MAQTNLTVRIDENLKREAEMLFNRIGMNMTTAVNIFFRQALIQQTMPFELKPYNDSGLEEYLERNREQILRSIEQLNTGQVVYKTLEELEAMEND